MCTVTGPQGPRGPVGPAGAAGIQGPQGPSGPNGLAATIEIEDSTRIPFDNNPYVLNVGTPQAAILRFGIPAGTPGATGAQGLSGEDGKSAYQIALDNGYVGTETEWLESLKGEKGPKASIIPFSIGKYGISISTDAQGEPSMIAFSGFAPAYDTATYLQEGEWRTGTITIRSGVRYPTSFIMTSNGILRKMYVLFSTNGNSSFEETATIRPFVCLAVSDSHDLVYKILPSTMVYTEPYAGGTYPEHTTRRGALINLDVAIPEGALVAIVVGMEGKNVTGSQNATFSVSGGLYLE